MPTVRDNFCCPIGGLNSEKCHAPALHFVGFRGEEFWSAVKVWGRPDFIHRKWDQRARREIAPDDTIIFATGSEADLPSRWNGQDLDEPAH
ncbi:MAG: hypothetical protein K0S56_311 [Microvirga sp.]|nr:hypothetical protein [Microvirga sp.]